MTTWSTPVRDVECDQQGIVFSAHYLVWCDEAVTRWFEDTGASYAALTARGLDTKVVSSTLDWASSARYGEVVDVEARTALVGRTSFAVGFEVRAGDRVWDDLRAAWGA